MSADTFVVLAICFASIALADDFKTINGKEYKNAKVSRVEPDGIVLITKWGISKIYFAELPKEVQVQFGHDPAKIEAERAKRIEEEQAAERERAEKQKAAERDRAEKERTHKLIRTGLCRPRRSWTLRSLKICGAGIGMRTSKSRAS